MEVAQGVQMPVDIKPVVNDKQSGWEAEGTPEAVSNNYAEQNIPGESTKTPEPELLLHSPTEEIRPVVETVSSDGETVPPVSLNSSEGAEVVTPAGTVEAPTFTNDTEAAENGATVHVKKTNETESPAPIVEHESHKEEQHIVDQNGTVAHAMPSTSTESTPEVASAPSPGKKTKIIVENRCSANTKEIHEFMEKHLNEKQQKRYIAPLLECIMQRLTQEATAKGEEVSVDVQSNICLIEQMFLTLGRRSPLEDMYTAEEEEMLDLLFHSSSSDNLLSTF
ncbi:Hypothetical protein PHPALM_11777 [Phytophthora palmivora]|uniref:Uncharacterized protein n=1 Tax=Phytophthora palmivora TaxID=4796 RepID=A0A2P4Y1E9_9STRA|nr:Hypothetical protein PHPALM_11777 [Phytophthora palmivora]